MNAETNLVTGASSDIGFETVKLLLKKNEYVWGTYNNNNKRLLDLKKKYFDKLFLSKYNFLYKNDLNLFVSDISKNKHLIKSFISLASLRNTVKYGEIAADDLNHHFSVNVLPVVLAIQTLGSAMENKGYGRILIGSSIGVKFGGSYETYCYSLTKLASELIPNMAKIGQK